MESKDRPINMKQFFFYMLDHIVIIILVAMVFAGLLGYYSYKNQLDNLSGTDTTINTIINQNKKSVYDQNTYSTDINKPNGVYNSSFRLYVDYKVKSEENIESIDLSQIYRQKSNDIISVCNDNDSMQKVIDDLSLNSEYSDMKNLTPNELRYLVNYTNTGANIITVTVSDIKAKRARDIAEKCAEVFVEELDDYEQINEATALDIPNLPKETKVVKTTSISKGTLAKFVILGAFLGFCIMLAVYFVLFLSSGVVRTKEDVEDAGIDNILKIAKNDGAISYQKLAMLIKSSGAKKIVLTAVNSGAGTTSIVEKVQEYFKEAGDKDIAVVDTPAMKESVEAMAKVADADMCVLITEFGKTKMADIRDSVELLKAAGADVKALVINKVRHG